MPERARLAAVLALAGAIVSCGPLARFHTPAGDGGWSPAVRRREIGRLAKGAGVALEPVDGASSRGEPLDLATALDRARSGSRRLGEAERRLDESAARVGEARAGLLPVTSGSGRYTWYSDSQTNRIDLPAGTFPEGAMPEVKIRDSEVGTIDGTIALPLDWTGRLRQALAAAQAGYRGERARLWAATLDEEVRVVRAYFDLLEARRLRDVADQRIAVFEKQLADSRARFENGRVTKNEVLVVDLALANAVLERTQRELAADRARWRLNETIGVAVDAPTEPVDVRVRPATLPAAQALRLAYGNNPVLESLVEEQQRLEATLRSLERSRLPELSGGGALDYSTSDLLQPQRIESGFVGFRWNLGSDGGREARIAEARAAAARNRLSIERQLRELESAVRFAQRAVEERLAAFAAAEISVSQAEENLRIRQEQFRAGRAASEDVLDAEALVAAERALLATALYQAHARRAELQQLIGLPLAGRAAPSRRKP
ncbi:MAG: outer membrane protein [Candidatus Binatota bacterium]|jgi:outer membrane protein|nr:outer membrane protein [Candidatus Binatota bacterium]